MLEADLRSCDCHCTCGLCHLSEYEEESDDYTVCVNNESSRFGPLYEWVVYITESAAEDRREIADGYEFSMQKDIVEANSAAQKLLATNK